MVINLDKHISSYEEIKKSGRYWDEILKSKYDKIQYNINYEMKSQEKLCVKESIDKKTSIKLLKIAKNDDVMLYTILLSIFKITLYRKNDNCKLYVGIPQYIKNGEAINNNTFILLDNKIDKDNTFKFNLVNERKDLVNALKNQFYPLASLYDINNIYDSVNTFCAMKNIHSNNQIQEVLNLSNCHLALIINRVMIL